MIVSLSTKHFKRCRFSEFCTQNGGAKGPRLHSVESGAEERRGEGVNSSFALRNARVTQTEMNRFVDANITSCGNKLATGVALVRNVTTRMGGHSRNVNQ